MLNLVVSSLIMFVAVMMLGGMLPVMPLHCMAVLSGVVFHFLHNHFVVPFVGPMLGKLLGR